MVRPPTRRDWIDLRRVRQRKVDLAAPWGKRAHHDGARTSITDAISELLFSNDTLAAFVDDELCGVAEFERDDADFRWYLRFLSAGSPRVDATDEVAHELWVALLEEGIKAAGRAGARRLFAFSPAEGVGYESLVDAGYTGYSRYSVLRGRLSRGLRESLPVREQHDSDLWSIHQLYNHTTPRPVQFAEALTSDAWAADEYSPLPFRSRKRLGIVAPTEEGIGAVCQIELDTSTPTVTLLCDDELASAIPSIVADSLEFASIDEEVDIVFPGYQQHLATPFLAGGFVITDEVIGMVRHTTATVAKPLVTEEALQLAEAQPAVTAPYRGLSFLDRSDNLREGL